MTEPTYEALLGDTLQPTRALRAVREWLQGDVPVCVLAGDIGIGKTVAGAWAIAEHGGVYMHEDDLYDLIHGHQDRRSELDAALAAPLFVVDEFGQPDVDGIVTALRHVVAVRTAPALRTLILGGLDKDELLRPMLERAGLAWDDAGAVVTHIIRGDSLRGTATSIDPGWDVE